MHLPFCRRKCAYCSFPTTDALHRAGDYLRALEREIRLAGRSPCPAMVTFPPDTLYFGGGSPSLLDPAAVGRIVETVRETFRLAEGAEISLEANPEDVTLGRAEAWTGLGVNRVTLGVQTVREATLRAMGRRGGARLVTRAAGVLRRAGCRNLAADLIAGLPGEGIRDFRDSLGYVLDLGIEHLSLYLLEVGEHSRLGRECAADPERYRFPVEDEVADFFLEARETVRASGLEPYEISNFARTGFASRHNLKYWEFAPYYGFGLSAHGFDGCRRTRNAADLERYIDCLQQGELPPADPPDEDPADRRREWTFLRLRLDRGFRLDDYVLRFQEPFPEPWAARLREAAADGLAEFDGGSCRLTPRGMLLSNSIFRLFAGMCPRKMGEANPAK